MRWRLQLFSTSIVALSLSACGGGNVSSTPTPALTPTPAPTPTPTPAPTPTSVNYDTAEYRRSSGPSYHGAITAYQAGASGAGVTVGIVDSGISDPLGEFSGRISGLSHDFGGNRGSITDVDGHGTAVAETLAGGRNDQYELGMAWGATILALRADTVGSCATASGCSFNDSAIAQAVNYAWQNGARVINLSLGSDQVATSSLLSAISQATAAGTIVVVAAGNADTGQSPSASPDAFAASLANSAYSHDLVIIATSVNANGAISSFSDGAQGYEAVTLSALGNLVNSIDNNGTPTRWSGTSFSAPQIAGTVALLAQAFPMLSSTQIVQRLLSTARDAGAAGPDSVYGMGILDVDAAFQPQGALSLAGTSVTVNQSAVSTFSTAMGDASATALGAVILDSYGVPYTLNFDGAFATHAPSSNFAGTLMAHAHNVTTGAGPLHLALSIAPGRQDSAGIDRLDLRGADEARARLLSGTIVASLSRRSAMAFGLRTGVSDLATMLSGTAGPSFLVAPDGAGARATELRATSSMAWRQTLGRTLALTSGIESGTVDGRTSRPGLPDDPVMSRPARYQAMSMALSIDRGALRLTSGLRLVDEQGSALGARFASTFGAQSARSLFASLSAQGSPAPGLLLSAGYQRGWTRAGAGGALSNGGLLVSRSWSLSLAQGGLLARGDLFGIRISAPLRVVRSRFDLLLPQSYDWQTGATTGALTPLNLTPRGNERDVELSYGCDIDGSWLSANLFTRAQPGNIATAPVDKGVALRWSLRF